MYRRRKKCLPSVYQNTVIKKGHKKWCATRQVDNEKNIKFLCCPVCAGQYFYAANNRS